MLRMNGVNSSRKWRIIIKNVKMEISDLSFSTFVQYVEDFCFWINVAGRIIYSQTFETLNDVIREAREELSTYRDILEISDRFKKWNQNKNFLGVPEVIRSD